MIRIPVLLIIATFFLWLLISLVSCTDSSYGTAKYSYTIEVNYINRTKDTLSFSYEDIDYEEPCLQLDMIDDYTCILFNGSKYHSNKIIATNVNSFKILKQIKKTIKPYKL